MTMSAEDFDVQERHTPDATELATNKATNKATNSASGPTIEPTAWGYVIRESDANQNLRIVGSVTGRFFGAILLLAAAGLWIMPDSINGGDLLGMKLAAMVLFSVFGGYFVWAGRHALRPEYRIDLEHREIRIGHRSDGGGFRQSARIDFADVSSVFLLRSKDRRPGRLFLRLTDLNTGLEIATGNQDRMEALKQRLTDDLTGQTRQPVVRQLDRHQRIAA